MSIPVRIFRHQRATDTAWFFLGVLALGCALGPGIWERIEDVAFRTIARALTAGFGALCVLAPLVNFTARIVVDAEGLRIVGAWGLLTRSVRWRQVECWYVRPGLWIYSSTEDSSGFVGPYFKKTRNLVFQLAGGAKITILETEVSLPFLGPPERFDGIVEAIRAHIAASEISAPQESAPGPSR